MSEITHEIHPQQKRIAHILSKCKAELSEACLTGYYFKQKDMSAKALAGEQLIDSF